MSLSPHGAQGTGSHSPGTVGGLCLSLPDAQRPLSLCSSIDCKARLRKGLLWIFFRFSSFPAPFRGSASHSALALKASVCL